MEKINDFINWMENDGWKITLNDDDIKKLPQNIVERYDIPIEYKQFLENIESCVNAGENVWFLCIKDYLPQSEDSFRWNEFELISLESVDDDTEINKIKNYWDKHFPIIMSVEDDYEYYAINVENSIWL